MDLPIRTTTFALAEQKPLIFIVKGSNAVGSSNLRLPVPWNMAVHLTARHWRTKTLWVSTFHFMMMEKHVSWNPLASLPVELGWKNTSAQRKCSRAINDDVFVWELGPYRVLALWWSNHLEIVVTPPVPSSCAQRSTGTWSCHLATYSRGCQRRTSFCTGKKCRGFFAEETWLEQHIDAMETFGTDRMTFLSGSTKVFSMSVSAVDLSSVS